MAENADPVGSRSPTRPVQSLVTWFLTDYRLPWVVEKKFRHKGLLAVDIFVATLLVPVFSLAESYNLLLAPSTVFATILLWISPILVTFLCIVFGLPRTFDSSVNIVLWAARLMTLHLLLLLVISFGVGGRIDGSYNWQLLVYEQQWELAGRSAEYRRNLRTEIEKKRDKPEPLTPKELGKLEALDKLQNDSAKTWQDGFFPKLPFWTTFEFWAVCCGGLLLAISYSQWAQTRNFSALHAVRAVGLYATIVTLLYFVGIIRPNMPWWVTTGPLLPS